MKTALVACWLLLLTAGATEARMRRVKPIQMRMVAYIGEKVEGTRPDFTWLVTHRGKRYELYVLKLDVLTGGVTPLDIDSAVAMYKVKFQIAGDKKAVEHFAAAPPRQQVLMTGFIRLDAGARFIMLDTVDVGAKPTPAPTP